MSADNQEYVLVTGDAGAARLALLHETYGVNTEAMLMELGIAPGMRAVDLGCGTGNVSCWMAGQVGTDGSVTGIDISAAQLDVAQREAQRRGLSQVRFQEGGVYDTGLPRGHFDLVYCRFLLCHVGDPSRALSEMRALLKPGGVILCEDVDVGSLCCDPPNAGLHRMRDIMLALGRSRGVDYCLGPRLHRLFREVGFASPEVRIHQPVHAKGEVKRFWEYTFLEAAPAMIQAGLVADAEIRLLARDMVSVALDEGTMTIQARKIQIWARKT